MQIKISKTALPTNTLAENSFEHIDYKDAYSCQFVTDRPISVDEVVYAFFDAAPKWTGNLLAFRDKLMQPFGLKVSGETDKETMRKRFKVEKGNGLGLFYILDKTTDEVLMGEDDKHLNFRISFLLTQAAPDNIYTFTLSTVVHMNNWFGRLYFLPVQPFHTLIVPGIMRGIVKTTGGENNSMNNI